MYQSYVSQLIFEMELRGYSPRTIHSYSRYLNRFLSLIDKPVSDITEEDLRLYLHSLVCRKVSTAYVNSVYSSTQLFFTHVLKRPFNMQNVPRVKNSKKLPSVLSFSEVISILDATVNVKHKAILMTAYSAGLRVSEVLALKVSDIDSANMQIHVRSGKGDKDRYTLLSEKTLLFLRQYFKEYRPNDWLFYSALDKSRALHSRTAQVTFNASKKKAGIIKPATFHTLRTSFATHLLIKGTDLFTIKTLLGHASIQTTMVYLHLTPSRVLSVSSPYDSEVTFDE
jgi:site-specific recombinase XerD